MPLTDELGNLIRERIPEAADRSPRGFHGGYFEAWLSRLAEPQPDLTESQNAANRSLFLRVADELHTIMQERELATLSSDAPWWLRRLVGALHALESTAITFNYDTLVEQAVNSQILCDWERRTRVDSGHVVRETPPLPPTPGRWGRESARTFRLLKLHGSLDSYWVPEDSSGATINRWILQGSWGSPIPLDESDRRQQLPGRSPFIVPPAAAKSAFYNNPVSRELWRSASEALSAADRVSLIGYSLPPTDLVVSGMLAEALSSRSLRVDVVNPWPEAVAERLVALGVPDSNLNLIGGADCVPLYVDDLERQAADLVARPLTHQDSARHLLIATSEAQAARVIGFEETTEAIYLLFDEVAPAGAVTQVKQGTEQPIIPVSAIQGLAASGTPIMVRYPDGSAAHIVAVADWQTSIGLGDGRWTVLVPSAMP
jgi:hypothetical protein